MRPRIVHVYKDVYPPVEGGIERTIYHIARLTRDEFEPVVITAASESGKGGTRRIDGDIEVIEVASWGRAMSTPIAPGFISALKKSGADLFHFHLPHPTGEIAYLLSRLKTPAVATYHSDIVRQKGALKFYRPILNRFLKRMSVIMPTSQRYLDSSEPLAEVKDRCEVVPLGLPLEDYEDMEETRLMSEGFRAEWGEFVFFLGVLRYYKGLHVLIEAMRELPGVGLVIAGEGNEKDRLQKLAGPAGINAEAQGREAAGSVHFVGRVDHTAAVALLRAASVFCLPATERSEAFGLCQIEALTCGLPIISTDLPTGVPEINRHGETGLIVPPGDSKALANAIRTLLGNPEMRNRMGEAGKRRAAEYYTAEKMAERVKSVYRRVLS